VLFDDLLKKIKLYLSLLTPSPAREYPFIWPPHQPVGASAQTRSLLPSWAKLDAQWAPRPQYFVTHILLHGLLAFSVPWSQSRARRRRGAERVFVGEELQRMGRLLVTFVAAAGFRGCRCRGWAYWARWGAPFPKIWGFLPSLARKEAQFTAVGRGR
jgi:hypothetical protein